MLVKELIYALEQFDKEGQIYFNINGEWVNDWYNVALDICTVDNEYWNEVPTRDIILYLDTIQW